VTGHLEHPAHDLLVAYADGRVDAADQEWIDTHLEFCAICAEDIADLREMQRALAVPATPALTPSRRRVRWVSAAGIVAAAVLAAVWLRPTPAAPETPLPGPAVVAQSEPSPLPPVEPAPAPSPLTSTEVALVARATERGVAPRATFDEALRPPMGTLLGDNTDAPAVRLTTPYGTAVESTRPEFRWNAVSGATTYSVSVYNEAFEEVASSGPLTGVTRWTPATDLPVDAVLSWQLVVDTATGRVVAPAPPMPEARLLVLPAARRAAIADARRRLADEPLALGLVLAEAGLYADARRALERAVEDGRYDAAAVRRIIASLS